MNPNPRATTHINAENAMGAAAARSDISAGSTAYADAPAPNTQGAIGTTTNRKRRWDAPETARSVHHGRLDALRPRVSGAVRSSAAATSAITTLTA